jgi:MoaA/NifB/PqqE/SkfB family radical SAM enzyme
MTYSPLRFLPHVFYKHRPLHLTFFVTRRCNARCPFCFYLSRDGKSETPELSLDEVERVFGSLGSLLWMAFSGGEVFLREDIVEISSAIHRLNRPSIMLFPTNGLMPELIRDRTSEILRSCPRSTVVVKLSLDGLEDRHDSLRGTPGGFRKVLKTYELLKGFLAEYPNFELGVNTVFCAGNQDDMDGVIRFVRGLDMIKTHTISMVRGDTKDGSLKDIDIDKYLEAVRKLDGDVRRRTYRFRGSKVKAAQDNLQRRIIYRTVKEKRQLIPCYAGRLNLVLTETGDVYPCESFMLKMGNIRDFGYDMARLLEGERAREAVSRIEKGCFCSHECYTMTNILFNPGMYPALLKELTRAG